MIMSILIYSELLTDFQRDKFTYFFYHVLDLNSDHVISSEDFVKLNARVMHYMDWSVNTIQFMALQVTSKPSHDIPTNLSKSCQS